MEVIYWWVHRLSLVAFILAAQPVQAQVETAGISGIVRDPMGPVIQGAVVVVRPESGGPEKTTKTDTSGRYYFDGLTPGCYTVMVNAIGFASSLEKVNVVKGERRAKDFSLKIATEQSEIVVDESDNGSDPTASTIVINSRALKSFSDDPTELEAELRELSGPIAGPNGGQVYVDGFQGGSIPPKEAIREARINENPFSAQFEELGYGRIDIFTKPGSDHWHGQLSMIGNDAALNARDPFVAEKPPSDTEQYAGSLGGPLGKHKSIRLNFEQRDLHDFAAVNTWVLDSLLQPVPFNTSLAAPTLRTNISARIDTQLNPSNTLTARYQWTRDREENDGVGQFALPAQGYVLETTENTIQLTDSQVLSTKGVNETQFEYDHNAESQAVVSSQYETLVSGAFTNGGNSLGQTANALNHFNVQNYSSIVFGSHFMRFGGELRVTAQQRHSTQGFNGTYTFESLQQYQSTLRSNGDGTSGEAAPSQFSVAVGNPNLSNTYVEFGSYVEDDWRVRRNFTMSTGLRYQIQNEMAYVGGFAPRVGIAWALGKKPNGSSTVIRVGGGIFLGRFTQPLAVQMQQLNGTNQEEFLIPNPTFYPTVLNPHGDAAYTQYRTIYQPNPGLQTPRTFQGAVSAQHQLSRKGTIVATYLYTRGTHQLFTRNINAPIETAPGGPEGSRPYGDAGNIYQYDSGGDYKQNQLTLNLNLRATRTTALFCMYALGSAHSDTSGPSNFPTDQYDLQQDYGRAAFDIRNRIFAGGNVTLPYGFQLNSLFIAHIGRPLNLTTGNDWNGDGIFNDRPAFATDVSRSSVVMTRYGALDTLPISGERIVPINYATAPAQLSMNIRVGKSIPLQRRKVLPPTAEGAGGSGNSNTDLAHAIHAGNLGMGEEYQRYITISADAQNVLNHVNVDTPVGVVSSPQFGQANALAPPPFSSPSSNRHINLQLTFVF